MSIGGGYYSDQSSCDYDWSSTKYAIDLLRSVGIATVISSGNDNFKYGIGGPACISSAVSVGNTTKSDAIYSGQYGSNIASFLSLLAPGTSILSVGAWRR